eukprot:1332609-Rhodomonas_salina.1
MEEQRFLQRGLFENYKALEKEHDAVNSRLFLCVMTSSVDPAAAAAHTLFTNATPSARLWANRAFMQDMVDELDAMDADGESVSGAARAYYA